MAKATMTVRVTEMAEVRKRIADLEAERDALVAQVARFVPADVWDPSPNDERIGVYYEDEDRPVDAVQLYRLAPERCTRPMESYGGPDYAAANHGLEHWCDTCGAPWPCSGAPSRKALRLSEAAADARYDAALMVEP